MAIFFECIGLWLATGNFPTRQNTFLTVDVKVEYFKLIKEVLKETFSSHYLFQPNHPNEWYEDLMNRFKKECKRSRCEDPTVFDVRKSEPLYRDLGEDDSGVRAKYLGLHPVDAKSVATQMIKAIHTNPEKWAKLFTEFIISRVALARGGEHAFVRWNEGTYDHRFRAPDFDWTMIKQVDKQCMLMFCDLSLYCLCPFFAFGVFFLFGNLQRAGVSAAKKDFVFWYLHHLRKDSIAGRLEIELLQKDKRKLQRMLEAAQCNSPVLPSKSPPVPPTTTATPNEVTRNELPTGAQHIPVPTAMPKSDQVASKRSIVSALDGVAVASKSHVGGIMIKDELERLWNDNIIVKKVKDLKEGAVVSKRMLFDPRSNLFVGCHPAFNSGEQARYCKCMTVVAMAIGRDDWRLMLNGGEHNSKAGRDICDRTQKNTMNLVVELEVQAGLRKPNQGCNAKPGIHSMGTRFQRVCSRFLKDKTMSQLEIDNMIKRKIEDEGPRQQTLRRSSSTQPLSG